MPQATTTTRQTNGNGDYTAVDPQKDPLSFVYQNRDALSRMDPDKAVKFADMIFRRYALPKYQKMNQQRPLDEEEVERLRLQFAARLFDISFESETKLKDIKLEHGAAAKAAATVEGAGAGVLGGIRTIGELADRLNKTVGGIDPGRGAGILTRAAGKGEKRAYESAQEVAPTGSSIGAAIGHQIPAAIATHGVESALPAVAKTAPLAARALSSGARGAVGGATFEASRPGGDPASGAQWGGVLGTAFPMLGKLFGLGRRAIASAPEAAKAVEGGTSAKAKAASATEAPKSLGDVANATAKNKFGKSFKDLTPSEKAQMPSFMKEEIAKQRVQQAATKKAEQAAAKAGREADAVAKRAEKAKAATAKAASQAAKRSETGAATSTQKQAVAAQAAAENPDVAKVMSGFKPGEGTSAAAPGQTIKTNVAQETESTKHELEKAKDILKNPNASKEEKRIAKDNYIFWKNKLGEPRDFTGKVAEGAEGKKVRAKEGKSASPAQQAADRERIAAKRAEAKGTEFGAALEKHAQELAGRHTAGSVGLMHLPELEEAMKEFPNGELFLKGFQKLRKAGRITDEIYVEEMKNWMLEQFEKGEPNKAAD